MRYFLFLFVFLFACDSATNQTFDKNAMIANIAENVIIAHYQQFAKKTDTLAKFSEEFSKSLNGDFFPNVPEAWQEAMLQWKKCELFNFGVAKDKNYMFDINSSEVRPKLIENALKDSANINAEYIKTLGAAAKGLPAIAFILQEPFLTLSQSKAKIAFLVGLTQNLNTNANALLADWKLSYSKTFMQNQDNSSLNTLANQLLALTENIATKRMDLVVKQYSKDTSLGELEKKLNHNGFIISNLETIQEVFTGKQGTGFDDYLDFLNAKFANRKLSEVMNEQIEKSKKAVQAIDNEEKAIAAQEELKKLLVLIKTDMFSATGIPVSFTDADGD